MRTCQTGVYLYSDTSPNGECSHSWHACPFNNYSNKPQSYTSPISVALLSLPFCGQLFSITFFRVQLRKKQERSNKIIFYLLYFPLGFKLAFKAFYLERLLLANPLFSREKSCLPLRNDTGFLKFKPLKSTKIDLCENMSNLTQKH